MFFSIIREICANLWAKIINEKFMFNSWQLMFNKSFALFGF